MYLYFCNAYFFNKSCLTVLIESPSFFGPLKSWIWLKEKILLDDKWLTTISNMLSKISISIIHEFLLPKRMAKTLKTHKIILLAPFLENKNQIMNFSEPNTTLSASCDDRVLSCLCRRTGRRWRCSWRSWTAPGNSIWPEWAGRASGATTLSSGTCNTSTLGHMGREPGQVEPGYQVGRLLCHQVRVKHYR